MHIVCAMLWWLTHNWYIHRSSGSVQPAWTVSSCQPGRGEGFSCGARAWHHQSAKYRDSPELWSPDPGTAPLPNAPPSKNLCFTEHVTEQTPSVSHPRLAWQKLRTWPKHWRQLLSHMKLLCHIMYTSYGASMWTFFSSDNKKLFDNKGEFC